jgi:DNA sulfur modification protein DndD
MKLIKLKFSNFRQFYGEQELEFSTDSVRHITLIHAENTVGKSAILNAVMWCLFGRCLPNYKKPQDLVNHHAAQSKAAEKVCKVTLEFEHERQMYSATRVYNSRTKEDALKVFQIDDGDYKPVRHAKSLINLILPNAMAEYFFFEGEGLGRLGEFGSRNSAEAIRTILGFTYVETVIEDLEKLKVKVRTELRKKQKEQKGLSSLVKEIEQYEKMVERGKKTKPALEQKVKEYTSQLNDLVTRIGRSGHKDAENAQKELNKLKLQENDIRQEIIDTQRDRQLLISKYGWAVFGTKLANKALDFIDESKYRGKIPSPHDEPVIKALLEDGMCICGRALHEGSDSYEHVKSILHTASTGLMHNRLTGATGIAQKTKGQFQEFLREVETLEGRLAKQQAREADIRVEKESQETIIREISQSDIQQLARRKKEIEEKLHNVKNDVRTATHDHVASSNHLVGLKRELNKQEVQLGAATRLSRQVTLYTLLIERCEERLETFEKEALDFLTISNNQALEKISRQERKFVLNKDFSFTYLDGHGQEIGRSDGETLLSNLVFVSSLIQFAKERVNVSDKFVVHGTIAPFLIDAPFGSLDETYKKEVAKYIPTCTEQLILLLSSSHWGTIDEHIREWIGKEYILVNHQTMERGERSEDIMRINGKEYQRSKYGAPIAMSSIESIGV